MAPMTPLEIIGHARRRIEQVRRWTATDTEATYLANEERQAAVERNFIALGEAIKDLSKAIDLKELGFEGPWKDAAGFRDFLAHRYDEGVSHPEVWNTIINDLPIIDAALAEVAASLQKQ
jgi:uncharacterized protein with HEPN domain